MSPAPHPITDPAEQERVQRLRLYQSKHAIDPEYPRGTREPVNWCRFCGVRVYPIKNGWRHDMDEVGGILLDHADHCLNVK